MRCINAPKLNPCGIKEQTKHGISKLFYYHGNAFYFSVLESDVGDFTCPKERQKRELKKSTAGRRQQQEGDNKTTTARRQQQKNVLLRLSQTLHLQPSP